MIRMIWNDGVVCPGGTAVMRRWVLGGPAPLGRPVALTVGPPRDLPLGRGGSWLAGEGTVVMRASVAAMGKGGLLWDGLLR